MAVTRHAARRRALDMLYEADLKDRPLPSILAAHLADEDDPPAEFAVALVRGVARHRVEIDALISAHARSWSIERMPIVDRNILRLGLFEVLHLDEVPTAVAINEAVELAKALSTDESPRFVNGILARIADDRPTPPPEAPLPPDGT